MIFNIPSRVMPIAAHTGQSIAQAFSSPAAIEAAYRFVRNDDSAPQASTETGSVAAVQANQAFDCLLANCKPPKVTNWLCLLIGKCNREIRMGGFFEAIKKTIRGL